MSPGRSCFFLLMVTGHRLLNPHLWSQNARIQSRRAPQKTNYVILSRPLHPPAAGVEAQNSTEMPPMTLCWCKATISKILHGAALCACPPPLPQVVCGTVLGGLKLSPMLPDPPHPLQSLPPSTTAWGSMYYDVVDLVDEQFKGRLQTPLTAAPYDRGIPRRSEPTSVPPPSLTAGHSHALMAQGSPRACAVALGKSLCVFYNALCVRMRWSIMVAFGP